MSVKFSLIPGDKTYLTPEDLGRRTFIATLTKALGATVLLSAPAAGLAHSFGAPEKSWTVGQIMDLFIRQVPGGPLEKTVDTLKAGNRDITVTGIVTTMFATLEVIQKAIALGANFIIAHEPTFYNHQDETDWLRQDEVYRYKADLLKKHNIAVWRNHDYIHRFVPDGVRAAVLKRLGWEKYAKAATPDIISLPAVPLKTLIQQVKAGLSIPTLRYIGDLSQPCRKILLLPGASGGRRQIEAISKEQPDVLLCGEISEWETAEYVRDARTKGQPLSLIVMGHIASEEPGSAFLATWLKANVPGPKITHVPASNSLSFL
jgi:putative NIF3 family GTP cyclohydrolase 1 type 2